MRERDGKGQIFKPRERRTIQMRVKEPLPKGADPKLFVGVGGRATHRPTDARPHAQTGYDPGAPCQNHKNQ